MIVNVGPFCRKGLSPKGEPRVQLTAESRLGPSVNVDTGRGKPRSPPRQGGPTEDCDGISTYKNR